METPGLPIRDLTEAKRVFEKELNWHEKISLVREIAYSRREELCRAYPDLMMIGHGLRQRQSDAGDPEIVDEPCVILAVRKKWQKGALPPEESTTLPEYLIAFCTVDGKRVPCAVPTDIEDGEAYLRTQPQAGSQSILVSGARGTPSGRGTLTCAIARSSNPDRVYALSCRHVFGINATADHQTGHQVSHDDHVFGQSTGIRGPLAAGPHYSMDAQLAEISDHHALSNALGNVRITNILQPGDPVPPIYYILTPNGPVEVQFRGWWENHVISYEGYGRICHDELLYSKCIQGSTQLGDSGSPVVSQLNGGTLLGMHIAISDYLPAAIPAWDLFNPVLYEGATNDERWTVLLPEQLKSRQPPPHSSKPAKTETTAEFAPPKLPHWLEHQTRWHSYNGSVQWRLTPQGLMIKGTELEHTGGQPLTVAKVWQNFGTYILHYATEYNVPVELIIATICTESRGVADAVREEPRWVSDDQTPHKVSAGLMQTLISTAKETLGDNTVDRASLLQPETSIRAGTAYIARQQPMTDFDPPKVACAYNAGSLRKNDGADNRWKMHQYPADTGKHADRFIAWFNDCFRYFNQQPVGEAPSIYHLLNI